MSLHPVMRQLRFSFWLAVLALAARADAATNVVTTLADSGPGSLRQVITDANFSGGRNVSLAVTGTINLLSSLPALNNVSILGSGASNVTIRGTNSNSFATNGFRIFTIPLNSTCIIAGVTISHGYGGPPGGGGILSSGVLEVSDCLLISNTATVGGGICSATEALTIQRCSLIRNVSRGMSAIPGSDADGGSAAGGGIFFRGNSSRIEQCNFIFNSALGGFGAAPGHFLPATSGGAARGGGLYSVGSTSIVNNCVFTSNAAGGGYGPGGGGFGAGGAAYFYANAQLASCRFFNNSCGGGLGGTVQYSGAGGGRAVGGAVAVENGASFITDSSLENNYVHGGDGGFSQRIWEGGPGGDADGGALWISSNTSLANLTILGNMANGGRGGDALGTPPLCCGAPGRGGNAYGGGIAVENAPVEGTNLTLSTNLAVQGQGGTGLLYASNGAANGGGFWANAPGQIVSATIAFNGASNGVGGGLCGPLLIRNCIVFGNSATNGADALNIASLGFNLFGDTNGIATLRDSDIQNDNAGIGSLQDNGGPTPTHALLPGSPAIDAGDDSLTGTDQRGRPRLSGAHVDIGAFEFQVPTPQSLSAPRRTTNGAFQFTFTNLSDATLNVLATTNVSLASTQWLNLGPATLVTNGLYQFTDPAMTNNRQRFFQLRWP